MTDAPKAKKSLGQHFLKNAKALAAIAESLAIPENATVIEVGPGHGELTDLLVASPAGKIIAIEKDRVLAATLKEKYAGNAGRITVMEGDALMDLVPAAEKLDTPYCVAGNIPYYITGYLLRIVGDMARKPVRTVFTIQKEVAERICAAPPRMNRLAACVQAWGTPRIVMKLGPGDFDPPPAIDSAIIEITAKNDAPAGETLARYYETAGLLFQQPRKTILNNLADGFAIPKENALSILIKAGFAGTERPENLTVETIIKISELTH